MPINFAAAAAKSLRNYRRCQRWFNYRNGKFQLKRSADPSPLLPTDPRPSPHPHLYLKLAGFRCHFLFGLQSKESNEREQKKENNVDNVRDPQPSRFTQSEKEKERGDRCKNLLWDTFAIFPSRSTRYTHTLAHVSTHTVKKVKKGKLTKRVQRGYAAWTIEAQNWVVPSALPFPIIPPPFCCLVAWAADGWLTGKLKARN